jgi:predicted nucleotidyltransferase
MINLFTTIYGSHLWKMDTPTSDYDIAEIYIVPTNIILSGSSYPKTLPQRKYESNDIKVEKTYWEVGHLIDYLIKGNQNAIWMTCSPLILKTCKHHKMLRKIVEQNLCKNAYHACRGMAESQLKDVYKRNLGMKGLRQAWRTLNFGIELLARNKLVFDSAPMEVSTELCHSMLGNLESCYAYSNLPMFSNEEPFRNWLYDLRMEYL